MKITRLRDLAGKAHFVGHDHHGHALAGEIDHDVEHLADHFGIERRGRLVEQHRDRVHRQRARDRDALLLAAGQFGRVFVALHRQPDALEQLLALAIASSCERPSTFSCARHRFSMMRKCGNSSKCWNTMPTRARSFGKSVLGSLTLTAVED
jgi:hypothetical protein